MKGILLDCMKYCQNSKMKMIRYKRKQLMWITNCLYPIIVLIALFSVLITYQTLSQQYVDDLKIVQYLNAHHTVNTTGNKVGGWKSIVWYQLWHGGLRVNAKSVDMNKCEYKKCIINFIDNARHKHDYFPTADAVIFQGGRLPIKPPKRAHPNQVYIFSTIESPIHLAYTRGGKLWLNNLNWTMTYRLDSDILYKYGSLELKKQPDLSEQDLSEAYDNKTKEVAWLVSDCVTESKRENYVKQLKKHIKVDVYGKCGHFKNCTKEEGVKCLKTIAKDYKFYLSFENSICKDYMTEKVFAWYKNMNIITVVRGARNYTALLPSHTYIDAHNFKSIKDLGMFLRQLGSNKNEYIKYLREKDKYLAEGLRPEVQKTYCELCKRLHNMDNYRKVYKNINTWWFDKTCQRHITDIH